MRLGIGLGLALLVGVTLGLMGGGGSILTVPILIYGLGVNSQSAIAMSLAIVGIVSLIGAIPHGRRGHISYSTALIFAPPAMVGAVLGAQLALLPWITPQIQLICFALLMGIAAIVMIRKKPQPEIQPTDPQAPSPQTSPLERAMVLVQGLGVGILTGFVGIGGGFMIIPALVLGAKMPMKKAVGTSLLIIAANATTGFAKYYSGGVTIDWPLLINFTVLATLGILLGSYGSQYLEPKQLEKGFGYFVLAVAAFMLIQGMG